MTLDDFIRDLRTLSQREPLMTEAALKKAAEVVRDEAKALIGTEDEAWAALAPATVEEKTRFGYVNRVSATDPLLRTGELRDSIEVGDLSPTRAYVGTRDPIGAYLEFGTSRVPPRPFIGTALFRSKAAIQHALGEIAVRFLRGERLDA